MLLQVSNFRDISPSIHDSLSNVHHFGDGDRLSHIAQSTYLFMIIAAGLVFHRFSDHIV